MDISCHISFLTLGTKPTRGAGTLACSKITRGTIVTFTNLLTPRAISSSTTWLGAIWSLEAWWTEAFSSVPAALIGSTLTLLLTPSTKCSWWASKAAGLPGKAWGTVTLAGCRVAGGPMMALAHTGAIHTIKRRWAFELTVAAIASRATVAAPRETITGGVGIAGTVQTAARAIASWLTRLVTVWPGPSQTTLALTRRWVADTIILTLTLEVTAEAPSVVGTDMLTAMPRIPGWAPTLSRATAHTPVFTLASLVALRGASVGEAGQVAGRPIKAWGTHTFSCLRVAGATITTLALLLALNTVASWLAVSTTVIAAATSWTVTLAGDGVAELRVWALALL